MRQSLGGMGQSSLCYLTESKTDSDDQNVPIRNNNNKSSLSTGNSYIIIPCHFCEDWQTNVVPMATNIGLCQDLEKNKLFLSQK